MNENSKKILIIGRDFAGSREETRGPMSRAREIAERVNEISPHILREGIENIASGISEALESINVTLKNYQLNEIAIKLEVSASGQIAILGNGVSATGSGGIELKFIYTGR